MPAAPPAFCPPAPPVPIPPAPASPLELEVELEFALELELELELEPPPPEPSQATKTNDTTTKRKKRCVRMTHIVPPGQPGRARKWGRPKPTHVGGRHVRTHTRCARFHNSFNKLQTAMRVRPKCHCTRPAWYTSRRMIIARLQPIRHTCTYATLAAFCTSCAPRISSAAHF